MVFFTIGALVDLISLPVTVGFTSATALIIGSSQIKGLLGIRGGSGSGFVSTISTVITKADEIKWPDALLGISSIVILLLIRVDFIIIFFVFI